MQSCISKTGKLRSIPVLIGLYCVHLSNVFRLSNFIRFRITNLVFCLDLQNYREWIWIQNLVYSLDSKKYRDSDLDLNKKINHYGFGFECGKWGFALLYLLWFIWSNFENLNLTLVKNILLYIIKKKYISQALDSYGYIPNVFL